MHHLFTLHAQKKTSDDEEIEKGEERIQVIIIGNPGAVERRLVTTVTVRVNTPHYY